MLIAEARWFRQRLAEARDTELFPLLNVGSQTASFRTRDQPWIEENIFAPLQRRGGAVRHLDMRAAPGVDIVADLTDQQTIDGLKSEGFRSVICSNLLEHVIEREQIAAALTNLLPMNGYLFVSVPYRYPYHPDPIDTLYRPTPDQLAQLFPGTQIVAKTIVNAGPYALELARKFGQHPVAMMKRLFGKQPAEGPQRGELVSRLIPWLFKNFKASCLVLRKVKS